MRQKVVCGNWKMNKTVDESVVLAKQIVEKCDPDSDTLVAIAPTFLALSKVADVVKGTAVKLAAQDVHFEDDGAYTGKVSVAMLKAVGVELVIVGHSEQRQYFHETNETVNKKVHKVLDAGLKAIICIGETLPEREQGQLESVLSEQIVGAYKDVPVSDALNTVIAYEPVWAIGTGVTASDDQAQQAHAFIRTVVASIYDDRTAQAISIQYGGSMNPANAEGLLSQLDIDGGLIGGAALDADKFAAIVTAG